MYANAYGAWMRAGWDAWKLGTEASAVIGLRVAKMAAGGTAGADEARLMVSEKVQAGLEMQAGILTGQFGFTPLAGTQTALRHYRRKVAANRRRLGR